VTRPLFADVNEDFMSDPHQSHSDTPHEGPIQTPKQVIAAVVAAFVIPIAVIVLLVSYVAADKQPAAGSDGLGPEAVAKRIQPVGRVEVKDVSDPSAMQSGEQVYAAVCQACHAAGVANAPKLGDAAAWAPRLKSGYDALLQAALKGKGAMGPQGGGDHTDLEIARAVVYLANKGGGKFEEPKAAPAAPKQAATQTTTTAAAPPAADARAAAAAIAALPPAGGAPAAAAAAGGTAPPLYAQICQACHVAGVAGAPKLGDKAAWAPRIAQGIDAMTATVIKGKGTMPPKGGSTASDAELKAVVTYMASVSK
jgi:cytochrome c5